MRLLPLILMLAGSLVAGEPAYPLWDGVESVAEYAKKVNLPPTKTLDLGNGVKLDLVLIPAGRFVMGTPEPTPVDEDGFHRKIITGQALLAASSVALLIMLVVVIVRAFRKKQRPKYSLLWFLLMIVMAGGCVLSGLHWRQAERGLEAARAAYPAAMARYQNANDYEKPSHSVTLTQPFYMGKFVITQEQYQQVTGQNSSNYEGKDNPVDSVSWDDAQVFCKKLTEQSKQTVRLPTEAEWEYSCRAGTSTAYYSGDTDKDLARVAWYYSNSNITTHPVGQKDANTFGLNDMHGNVYQWCEDRWDENYYSKSSAEDPQGPAQGSNHVIRGGSYLRSPMDCRSASRFGFNPDGRFFYLGFRIAMTPAIRPTP